MTKHRKRLVRRHPIHRHLKAGGAGLTTAAVVASPYIGAQWILPVCLIVVLVVAIAEEAAAE